MKSVQALILVAAASLGMASPAFALRHAKNSPVSPASTATATATATAPTTSGSSSPAPVVASLTPDEQAREELVYRANLGRADDVKYLIKHGGSPDQLSGERVPIISLASARKDAEGLNVVKMLVELDANINARDKNGQTALFYAAKKGNLDVAKFLLESKIDLYALDNKGDVARTVAFRTGHLDVVKAMDDFVIQQTRAINEIYQERNKALQDITDKAKEAKEAEAAAKAKPPEPPKEAAPPAPPPPTPKAEEKPAAPADDEDAGKSKETLNPAEEAAAKALAEQLRPERERKLGDLAFHTCAFQYWSYCSGINQSTELESEELTIAIQSHQEQVDALKIALVKDYKADGATISKVQDSSQQRIYNQLNLMASNRDRHEKGVGKMDDMETRCEEISRQWSVAPPGLKKPVESSGAKGSSGGGSHGGGSHGGGAKAGHKGANAVYKPGSQPQPGAAPVIQ